MKERPILFSAPMVRAILEGRKTQTRRIVKPPFEIHPNGFMTRPRGNERLTPYPCPHGQPGDRLWVRETWRIADTDLCGCGGDYCTCGMQRAADLRCVIFRRYAGRF